MSDSGSHADIEALIAQFQALQFRELHLRCGDLEVHLSTDATGLSIESGNGPGANGSGASPPVQAEPRSFQAEPRSLRADAPHAKPPAARQPIKQDWPPGATLVRAPYLGTFYRAPKPGSPAFVEVGSTVVPGADLCLIEVMKLFTTLRAQTHGTVHAVVAKDGELVEAEQPLFVLVSP